MPEMKRSEGKNPLISFLIIILILVRTSCTT